MSVDIYSLHIYSIRSDSFTVRRDWEFSCRCRLAAGDDDAAPGGVLVATTNPACTTAGWVTSAATPLSPTFISSLPIKHDLSAHFEWRHLIACCWGRSPNRLSAGSYGDYMNCMRSTKLWDPHPQLWQSSLRVGVSDSQNLKYFKSELLIVNWHVLKYSANSCVCVIDHKVLYIQ